jgi:hypothetical protein
MATPNDDFSNVQSELVRRHKTTARTVQFLIIGVVLLGVLAFVSQRFFVSRPNPALQWPILIAILMFGLGAIAFRRTRFATMRLQDIAALKGGSGLLRTLERTTLQLALIGAAAAVTGFMGTLLTGDRDHTLKGTLVAIVVLLYCYPTRKSWQRALERFAPYGNSTGPAQ